MKRLSYTYQIKSVRRIHQFNGRALVSLDTGLGKTQCALLHAHRNPNLRPVVVVCPGYLKWQWQNEITNILGERSEVLEGMTPRRSIFRLENPILIINYDILHKWVKYLKKIKPKILIIDECQMICNRKNIRTKAVQELSLGIPHVLALSATPFTNRPAELWTILNILRPDLYPSFFPFGWKYCQPKKEYGRWKFNGAENLDLLHKRLLKHCMIRVRKEDVFPELPPKIRRVVPLELSDRKEYNSSISDFRKWVLQLGSSMNKEQSNSAFAQIEKIKQLIAKLKMPFVFEWINNFLETTDEKLLVFGIHQATVKKIHQQYPKNSVLVYGDIDPRHRQYSVERFQKDKKCRLFVGNIQAGGVGLNLTAATQVAFIELPWKPSDLSQAEDRCFGRVSDLHGAIIHYILGKGTIEEWLCKTIQRKQRILDAVLDNGKVDLSFDVFNEFLAMIKDNKKELRRGTAH